MSITIGNRGVSLNANHVTIFDIKLTSLAETRGKLTNLQKITF
jgi:hypothetical protein